jgi:O-methyltransferase
MERIDRNLIAKSYENIRSENPWTHTSSNRLHHKVLPFATLAPWLNDLAFLEIYE